MFSKANLKYNLVVILLALLVFFGQYKYQQYMSWARTCSFRYTEIQLPSSEYHCNTVIGPTGSVTWVYPVGIFDNGIYQDQHGTGLTIRLGDKDFPTDKAMVYFTSDQNVVATVSYQTLGVENLKDLEADITPLNAKIKEYLIENESAIYPPEP